MIRMNAYKMITKNNTATMKNIFRHFLIALLCLAVFQVAKAEEYKDGNKSSHEVKATSAGCAAASSFRFLDVNNVRARINTGGDMWWDLNDFGQYYIPKGGTATSLFSGSLWIGGLDINNQLKLAAVRYRQSGNDYWPGPLTIDGTASVDENTCAKYDKHFLITRAEVDEYIAWWNSENRALEYPDYSIPQSILEYPAHGDVSLNQSYYLAPFRDMDGDGDYNPNQGDYPYYDITNELCPLNYAGDPNYVPQETMEETMMGTVEGSILVDQVLKGDQTLWWIFNDKGNFHSETQGASIGFEIRAQAFGFATNDEINNMSFYTYEIINRSTFTLTGTYFSPWVDTDLGYAWDDYVGCDVTRGLGYCYNGVSIDGAGEPESYGDQPPAIGVDFFQGPYIDPDGKDNPKFTGDCSIINSADEWDQMAINGVNFGNLIVDDERFGMRRFVYHNNSGGPQGDPSIAPEYYNYLRGFWKDNTHMLYGGNAHFNSGAVGPECDFMFPGDSDPCNWGTQGTPPNGGYNQNGIYWTEESADNNPYDRRFMQSAGPFTLDPGSVNYITVGIPWARATSGGPWASVELLRVVDDKCQKLFDNCFKVLDGPDAPDLSIVELNKELIFYISNSKTSNNYLESYAEYDNTITQPLPGTETGERSDSLYRFEGYQIYQLSDATVTLESKNDADQVRLVAQFDVQNGVTSLVNYYFDKSIGGNVPVVEVEGGDNGVVHSFSISEDQFGTTNRSLTNFKQYYYTVVAYSYNEFLPYSQEPAIFNGLLGQKKPYLAGRRNIKTYTAIPHPTINGTVLNSEYGSGPQVTRVEGNGNGGMFIDLSAETITEIMNKPPADSVNKMGSPDYPIAYNATYNYGLGPINVKVIDPLNVESAQYRLEFTDVVYRIGDSVKIDSAMWTLTNVQTGEIFDADKDINYNYEQLFLDLGISIQINQPLFPGDSLSINNGLLGSATFYEDPNQRWVSGLVDSDLPASPANWIRSGTYLDQGNSKFNDWNMPHPFDAEAVFEKIADATWTPYVMAAHADQSDQGPAYNSLSKTQSPMGDIASIDIVLTANKDLWSRSVVLEMCADDKLSEGNVDRFDFRAAQSVDKDGNPAPVGSGVSTNPNDPNYIAETGMGWFPGYAINIETGERLNIMFGENSFLVGENGRDMLFNPTSNIFGNLGYPLFGGQHYVYIMNHKKKVYPTVSLTLAYDFPAYDACDYLYKAPHIYDTLPSPIPPAVFMPIIWSTAMWVGIPLSVPGETWLPEDNDWKLSIRMSKPYQRYFSTPFAPEFASEDTTETNWPAYIFNTEGVATTQYSSTKAESDLDLINIVPNPYYAYDSYERNALDNRIKITNLPQKVTVTIYNVNGTLVRQLTKDSQETYIDWDLKNFAGIPVAGGVYIFHINTDVGEKVLKWFGILRPPDLNTF